jgi:hypothetical protein
VPVKPRWICRDCRNLTSGSRCGRCVQNSGIFTGADMDAPIERAREVRPLLTAEEAARVADSIAGRFTK